MYNVCYVCIIIILELIWLIGCFEPNNILLAGVMVASSFLSKVVKPSLMLPKVVEPGVVLPKVHEASAVSPKVIESSASKGDRA